MTAAEEITSRARCATLHRFSYTSLIQSRLVLWRASHQVAFANAFPSALAAEHQRAASPGATSQNDNLAPNNLRHACNSSFSRKTLTG